MKQHIASICQPCCLCIRPVVHCSVTCQPPPDLTFRIRIIIVFVQSDCVFRKLIGGCDIRIFHFFDFALIVMVNIVEWSGWIAVWVIIIPFIISPHCISWHLIYIRRDMNNRRICRSFCLISIFPLLLYDNLPIFFRLVVHSVVVRVVLFQSVNRIGIIFIYLYDMFC